MFVFYGIWLSRHWDLFETYYDRGLIGPAFGCQLWQKLLPLMNQNPRIKVGNIFFCFYVVKHPLSEILWKNTGTVWKRGIMDGQIVALLRACGNWKKLFSYCIHRTVMWEFTETKLHSSCPTTDALSRPELLVFSNRWWLFLPFRNRHRWS